MSFDLDPFFRPGSIAVIGASRRPGTIGYQILDNLLRHGYQGVVYPVNPRARAIHSIPAFPSVTSIPDEVDLAVVVVPKEIVLEVVEECGEKGVKGVVVITAGFKEVGGEGVVRELELVACVRRHGMRLVGPNCMGLINTEPSCSMNATFAPSSPPPGPMSFMSQSGALGVTILDHAAALGIGINHFVSVGNKPDVSGNDLLEYWEHDDATRVILMYLENFGNPRTFTRLARRVSKKKPIVVVKAGRTLSGARAASSHTGALAHADVAVDALLAQCGVLRAKSVNELFDIARALEEQPIPRGNRVAIVTNAGGPGIIAADSCESRGLDVVELSEETQARLRESLPAEASVRNPVDMIASANAESYRTALDYVLSDPGVDAAIAAFVPPLGIRQVDVASAIVAVSRKHADKPVLAVLMGREGLPEGQAELHEAGIPAYTFPESAARALSAMTRYQTWRERPVEEPTRFQVKAVRVTDLLDRAQAEGREHLLESEALEVLDAYGIPTVERRIAQSEDEAVQAGEALGYPLVLKLLSPDVIHKSEVGGVRVDLRDGEALREAWKELIAVAGGAGAHVEGILVERFRTGGKEMIVGVATDPVFGPILMLGLGGIYVEALGDVAFRIQPVSRGDAREMLASLRGGRLLDGVRGEPAVDKNTLVEVVERVSQLVGDHHRIMELDINPFLALPDGGVALDARIRVSDRPTTTSPWRTFSHAQAVTTPGTSRA
ncbi:MAG TPA: acetate--CoA ligase family protein [Longimicrobiales bacterium]|jgi:acetyl coenzyme A synthetase (ADP forming)-like protein